MKTSLLLLLATVITLGANATAETDKDSNEKQLITVCKTGDDTDKLDEYSIPQSGDISFNIYKTLNSFRQPTFTLEILLNQEILIKDLLLAKNRTPSPEHAWDYSSVKQELEKGASFDFSSIKLTRNGNSDLIRGYILYEKTVSEEDNPRKSQVIFSLSRFECVNLN